MAGSPAVDFNSLYAWRARFLPLTGPSSGGAARFVPPALWKTAVHAAVLRQCDATLDGVADGILEDPSLCRFDASALLCDAAATNSSACLSAAQVATVRAVFSPYTWANGTLLYPAMNPGSELIAADGLYSGQAWPLSQDWFRYAVYGDPAWDPAAYTLQDAANAARADPGHMRTYPSTLGDFQRRGGRMVMFHGQQDNQISSFNTPRFYEHLRAGMGYSVGQMDNFLRFFRISGMFHCNSGPGAWVLGQSGGSAAQGPFDAKHNVLAALVEWVERGNAPETMTGTKYVNDTVSSGVDFQRSHCKWPLRNTYLWGGKDAKDPASWQCKEISEAEEEVGALATESAGEGNSPTVPLSMMSNGMVTAGGMKDRLSTAILLACFLLGLLR